MSELQGGTETALSPPNRAPRGDATARITLIRPPVVVLLNSMSYIGPMPSIGLAYIAATLREAGHEITVIDAVGEGIDQSLDFDSPSGTMRRIGLAPEEVLRRIPSDTQLVGITHMFLHEWPQVRELAEAIKGRFPEVPLILGGENATSYRDQIFTETEAIDACVIGEGERTAVALADRVAHGQPFGGLDSVATRPGAGDVAREPNLPVRIRDLSSIPRPAWDLFPLESYLRYPSTFGVDRGRTIPMLATRGCPYKCSFCSAPKMWTSRYTVRDPEDIVDEIEEYIRTYGIDNVDFVDLTAMTKRKWTLQFCDALEARGLHITWQLPVGARSESMDEHLMRRLSETGCKNITLAPESGSERMLEIFDKRVDLDHVLDVAKAARRAGVITHLNTIIGHPKETARDRWENYWYLIRAAAAGVDTASAITFHPYPGSRDYRDLAAKGKIDFSHEFIYDGIARGASSTHSWNDEISSRGLRLTQLATMGSFFLVGCVMHPSRIIRFVRVAMGEREQTIYEQGMRSKLRGLLAVRKGSREASPVKEQVGVA